LIDLHTHTTASDGRCTPAELVARASEAGVRVLAVTDHDTVAACDAVAAACAVAGIEFVTGIEITAVREGTDVHTLGYFLDTQAAVLAEFLNEQRRLRIERLRLMIDRLSTFGIVLDGDAILKPARDDSSKSAGRPWIARALVAGGHVASISEAFDRWLSLDRPAFVARMGAPPEEVVARVHEAGGIASIAHPGLLARDEWLPPLVEAGLDAIEAYHTDHDEATTARYVAMAEKLGVAVSGGSDYHGDQSHRAQSIGDVSLPGDAYERLKKRKTEK
jgi:predicted metal-dependent phosphoesterase TrpH